MKRYYLFLLIMQVVFFSVKPIFAEEAFVVIVNPKNIITEMTLKELRDIYRLRKKSWMSGAAIDPLHLGKGTLIRDVFCEKVIKKSSDAVNSYYLKWALSGKGQPPKIFYTEEEILEYVSINKNAIGYVSKANGSVKTLSVE